jgi:protein O-mannosyl-transferase
MKRNLLLVGLLLCWLPALRSGYFWDDRSLILQNPALGHLDAIFGQDLAHREGAAATPFYRPMMLLSLSLDQLVAPGNPLFAHVHSLGWHLLGVALLGSLVRRRLGEEAALGAMLIFGLHPVQSEAVVWLSARNDLMAAAGVLGALLGFDRGFWVGGGLMALLAGLSKEQALLLPAALPLWRLSFGEKPRWAESAVALAAAGVVFGLRSMADVLAVQPSATHLQLFAERWILMPSSMLGWLLLPWPLTSSASLYQPLPGILPLLLALLSIIGLVGLLIRERQNAGLVGLALAFFAPAAVAVAATTLIGERYLYLPLAFLAIAVARVVPLRLLGLWAVLVLPLLELRLWQWSSEAELTEVAAAQLPDAYTRYRLAVLREAQGDSKAAFRLYMDSIQSDPPFLGSCAPPIRLLKQVGATEPARTLHRELSPLCQDRADFQALGSAAP